MNSTDHDKGDPTQQAPELIAEIVRATEEAKLVFTAVRDFTRETIERLSQIETALGRSVRRLEILKQTLQPLPPIEKKDDFRLCAGERIIISVLKGENGPLPHQVIQSRTGYADSSLRTWLPMLREKGIVELECCQYDLVTEMPVNYRRQVEAIKPMGGGPQ